MEFQFQSWPDVLAGLVLFAVLSAAMFGGIGLFTACMFIPGPFLFHQASRNRASERIATRLNEQFRSGGLFHLPSITFQHRGRRGRLDIMAIKRKTTKCYPRLTFSWADQELVLEIDQRGFRIGHPGIRQREDRTLKTRLFGYPEIPLDSAEL